jgi:hypothetical protein
VLQSYQKSGFPLPLFSFIPGRGINLERLPDNRYPGFSASSAYHFKGSWRTLRFRVRQLVFLGGLKRNCAPPIRAHHPDGEIDIDPFHLLPGAPGFGKVQVFGNILALVKLLTISSAFIDFNLFFPRAPH